jgi:hypothetical protein
MENDEMSRGETGDAVDTVATWFPIIHDDDLQELNDLATRIASNGARAGVVSMGLALLTVGEEMRCGADEGLAAELAAQQNGIIHETDLEELRQRARDIASTGGPRANVLVLQAAIVAVEDAIRRGVTAGPAVQSALAVHGITHVADEIDLADHATSIEESLRE